MANLLNLPFKTTSPIPIRTSLREHIQTAHPETHPDAFKWDISRWESMRKDAVNHVVHVGTVDKMISYQAQLVFILTKLPADINLQIPYSPAFPLNSRTSPLILSNLHYERANVLYNLATLYCNLAASEDRSHGDGIKRALANFQNAAGVLSHLISSAIPALQESLSAGVPLPADLSPQLLKALQCLMLAQAQECFWQRAAADNMKNVLVGKLAAKTSSLYGEALEHMESDTTVSSLFPWEWIAHVRTKHHHFAAASLYRKSVDDLEAHKYGDEIARLDMGRAEAKRAVDAGRKGGVAKAVQEDAKSLLNTLESSFKRAERDNDLIYHKVVPSASSVPPIPDMKDVVFSNIPAGIQDPKSLIGENAAILGELSGWGVRVAVDIYKERRKDWIQTEVLDKAKELDAQATSTLQSLNLPAALDALDKPIGMPPSLLGKAEEVRSEDGTNRISRLIEDVQKLAKRNMMGIDEALDLLDQEATEDEEMRSAYTVDVWTRPPSHEANKELIDQAARYRDILDRAMHSDRDIFQSWDDWSEKISVLCWNEADIERSVPSSTLVSGGGSRTTQAHARALRSYLEALEDSQQARTELVNRIQRVTDADDVAPRFMREASSLARWVEVRPDMFEQAIEEELNKFERYRIDLEENEHRQEEVLNGIRERNTLFLDSRRDDPSVKQREKALQELDLAYIHYRDIQKHLAEGIKFYNDLGTLIGHMKDHFKAWILHRRKDVE
ncbi:hypothetical protein M422DRAFT_158756 [Sphaerobolus stellatus SS14]|nr:hypothetical protein M422DRAFT_158756 [Sphaerobolus stellatus SS14]